MLVNLIINSEPPLILSRTRQPKPREHFERFNARIGEQVYEKVDLDC